MFQAEIGREGVLFHDLKLTRVQVLNMHRGRANLHPCERCFKNLHPSAKFAICPYNRGGVNLIAPGPGANFASGCKLCT